MDKEQLKMYEEQLRKQLDELNLKILRTSVRASGRTYRIANGIIQSLFENPIGTWVNIIDHYQLDRGGSRCLADMLTRRLKNDFPQVKFTIDYSESVPRIKRETKLPKEVELEELEKQQQELLNQTFL